MAHLCHIRFFCIILMITLSNAISLFANKPLSLAKEGVAQYKIVVDADSGEEIRYASEELQKHLNLVTGGSFAIANQALEHEPAIYVGRSPYVNRTCLDVDFKDLKTDGILIRTVDQNLILVGGMSRGTIYAVYTFLQDHVGCRWYAPDEQYIPQQKNLSIKPIRLKYVPQFLFREYYSQGVTDPAFAAKMRLNGREFLKDIPQTFGGGVRMGSAHTLTNLFVKPKEHFEKHPEWFAWREKEGKRVTKQLCKTNPALQQQVLKEVLAYLDKNYTTMPEGHKLVSVSCPDNADYCQCENCLKLIHQKDTPAAPLVELLNVVAHGIKDKYPDVKINTLAYWHTDKPPRNTRLADNVIVQIGTLDRNHRLPIRQTRFHKLIQGWKKSARNLYIWDYDANFRNFMEPHPNHFIVGESLRYYHRHGIQGVFFQGSWGNAAELHAMRTWVYGQMLWDPRQRASKLMSEFCNAYYGPAGKHILQYIEHINNTVNRNPKFFLGAYNHSTHKWLTLDALNTATELFDAATERVKDDPIRAHRVKVARLSIELVWIHRYDELRDTAIKTGKKFLGPKDPYKELDRLEENEFGISVFREWQPYTKFLKQLREKFPKPSAALPPELQNTEPWRVKTYQQDAFELKDLAGKIRPDDSASNHQALVIENPTLNGYITYHIPPGLTGQWRILISLRAEPQAGETQVDMPICAYFRPYPGKRLKETARVYTTFTPENSKQYQLADLGTVEIAYGTEIQVQPKGVGHFGKIGPVYVDRIMFIKAQG